MEQGVPGPRLDCVCVGASLDESCGEGEVKLGAAALSVQVRVVQLEQGQPQGRGTAVVAEFKVQAEEKMCEFIN